MQQWKSSSQFRESILGLLLWGLLRPVFFDQEGQERYEPATGIRAFLKLRSDHLQQPVANIVHIDSPGEWKN